MIARRARRRAGTPFSQLPLFRDAVARPVGLPLTRRILTFGADAGDPRLRHKHAQAPSTIADVQLRLGVLAFAERALRFDQPWQPRLQLARRPGMGLCSAGGPDGPWFRNTGTSVTFGTARSTSQHAVTWTQLLRALRQLRACEPEVAQLPDLAEAYRLLARYGAVYRTLGWSRGWTPVPLVKQLAGEVLALGGGVTAVPVRTAYMAEAVAEAIAERSTA